MKRRLVVICIAVACSVPLAVIEQPGRLEAAAYKEARTVGQNRAPRTEKSASQKRELGTAPTNELPKRSAAQLNEVRVNAPKPSPMPSGVPSRVTNVLKLR